MDKTETATRENEDKAPGGEPGEQQAPASAEEPAAEAAGTRAEPAGNEDQPAQPAVADAATPPTPAPAEGEPVEPPAGGDDAAGGEAPAEPPEAAEPREPTIEEQLAEAQQQLAQTKEQVLRVAADFDNYRKRTNRELEQVRRRGMQVAVKDLLPVFDNLERATSAIDESSSVKAVIDGLQLVTKQFVTTLAKLGIERVEALGQPFNPSVHDSIQHLESTEHPAGVVMAELQAGYRMGDELLRAALVVVSKGPPLPPEPPADEAGEEPDEAAGEPASELSDAAAEEVVVAVVAADEAASAPASEPPADDEPGSA